MTLKEYRDSYQYKLKDDVLIGYIISVPLSFLLNKIFYKPTLIPNRISFLMLLSGLLGGALFFHPNNWVKLLGFIFMHLWFVFDAWDGAVARQTKTFSEYGKEFDYLVHSLVHPLFLYAMSRAVENNGWTRECTR